MHEPRPNRPWQARGRTIAAFKWLRRSDLSLDLISGAEFHLTAPVEHRLKRLMSFPGPYRIRKTVIDKILRPDDEEIRSARMGGVDRAVA